MKLNFQEMKLNFLEMKLNFFGNEVKQKEAKKVPVRKSLNGELNRKKCEVKLQVFLQYLPAMPYTLSITILHHSKSI